MGKGKNRNRRRSQAAKLAAKFTSHTHQQILKDAIRYEHAKEGQLNYAKVVADLEKNMISKTLFVTGVRNLREPRNVQLLKFFFEQNYGPVEDCFASTYGPRRTSTSPRGNSSETFPPGRVRFRNLSDYDKVLASKDKDGLIYCPSVGVIKRSCIKVGSSLKYDDMTKDVLEGHIVQFNTSSLSLGHWIKDDMIKDDMFKEFEAQEDDEGIKKSQPQKIDFEWLEACCLLDTTDLRIEMNLSKRIIKIERTATKKANSGDAFNFLYFLDTVRKERMTFRFKEIDDTIELCKHKTSNNAEDEYCMIISLKHPPKIEESVYDLLNLDEHEDRWTRCIKFGNLEPKHFGDSFAIRITVSSATINTLLINRAITDLNKFGVLSDVFTGDTRNAHKVEIRKIGLMEDNREIQQSLRALHNYDARLGLTLRSLISHHRFCWYYALNSKIVGSDGSICNIFQLIQKFSPMAVLQTLNQILNAVGKTKLPCYLFCKLVDDDFEEQPVAQHCASIPRVLLTPCRLLILPFETEMSNRVVRKFIDEEGFSSYSFLRIQVADENGRKIFGFDFNKTIEDRITNVLTNGFDINGRHYSFLAYSSSQLKESSIWMVSPEGRWDVQRMRQSMGDFSSCLTPSKYAARIGQCFSTTYQGLAGSYRQNGTTSSMIRHTVVSDIPSSFNNVPHSDGNGLISQQEMEKLLRSMPNVSHKAVANTSVVQIRFGGAKGILVAWDQKLIDAVTANRFTWKNSYDVLLRSSMIKFSAPFEYLEVCRLGSHVPYYLNRHVVLLLGTHGVKHSIFLELQGNMLQDLEKLLEDRVKAIMLLPRLGGPDQSQRMRLLHVMYSGLSPRTDPFLFSCCVAIRSHHLFGLRKKTRILIEEGAVLLGAVDETKLLPEYCVFLQVRKNSQSPGIRYGDNEFEPIVGPVMVTKHPVMHPGDVRMLLAVDIPQLRKHKNVLLFSQKGSRPEPNKMSGSDLDGDEYAVTWDPQLFLGEWNSAVKRSNGSFVGQNRLTLNLSNLQLSNREPADYINAPSTPPLGRSIGKTELVEHFIKFIKNDSLGQIAMGWLDWAAKNGADCQECIELAGLHSIAVDFAKSGVPATVPKHLKWKEAYAHWRENKNSSRPCTSIVGQLYDRVVLEEGKKVLKNFPDGLAGRKIDKYGQVLSELERDVRPILRRNYQARIPAKLGWLSGSAIDNEQKEMILFANEERFAFEEQVSKIMNKYHLRSEGELFTGCIRKYHKLHKKRQHQISEDVRRQCSEICQDYRAAYFEQVLEFSGIEVDEERSLLETVEKIATSNEPLRMNPNELILRRRALKLAAAYYVSTYSDEFRERNDRCALFSFPWVIADVIASGLDV